LRGTLFHAPKWAAFTEGKEFGLLPTPLQRDCRIIQDAPNRQGGKSLASTLLPTPTASNACNGNGWQRDKSGNVYPTLSGAVGAASMPTPTARDWKHGSAAQVDKPRSENLNDRAAAITGKTKLNPEFVASMMGFPIDWFDLT